MRIVISGIPIDVQKKNMVSMFADIHLMPVPWTRIRLSRFPMPICLRLTVSTASLRS